MIIVSRGQRPQPLDTTPGAIEDNMTSIRFTIYSAELYDMHVTDYQVESYRTRLHGALTVRYPGAEIEVPVVHRTSGSGSGAYVESYEDGVDERLVAADVRDVADRVLSDVIEGRYEVAS